MYKVRGLVVSGMAWLDRARLGWITAPVLLLVACAAPPMHFGNAGLGGSDRSFTMSDESEAAAHVRQALVDAGYQEESRAKFRVEVGFSVRPRGLSVVAPSDGKVSRIVSPATKRSLSMCKRQAYVLTVAFVERATGTIASRGGSTIARCEGTPAEVLPRLAQTAISSAAQGEQRSDNGES